MWYSGNYGIQLQLTKAQAENMSHSGRCDDDVAHGRTIPAIRRQLAKLDSDTLARELREYGAWNDEELADHDANLSRILWIAASDIRESIR